MKGKIISLVLILGLVLVVAVMGGCAPVDTGTGEQGTTGGITSYLPIIIVLVLLFGMFYFLMVRPMRQREKKHDEMIEQLHLGDKVITASGIFGQIESITQDSVVIKVESGATLRVTKGSILSLRSAQIEQ